MLSDDSSSDSETGRFKCQSKNTNEKEHRSSKREDNNRSARRSRHSDDRSHREITRHRDEREKYERHSKDRHRYPRYSPPARRRSNDRSRHRRSPEKHRYNRESRDRSKPRDYRSVSRDRRRSSRSQSHKSPVRSRNIKDEIKGIIHSKDRKPEEIKGIVETKERRFDEQNRKKSTTKSLSPDVVKKSIVHKPVITETQKRKSDSPILIEEHGSSDVEAVHPGSYYNLVPAIPVEKTEESSEIDSSDDEKLRAKLLNLEKQLQITKKKKHKKKHKRKCAKYDKEIGDSSASVEVSSTTDIQEVKIEIHANSTETAEVTSTQKSNQKEGEEGEILSDDDSQFEIDPTDLRHKLKRSKPDSQAKNQAKLDVCGPALPPHLEKHFRGSTSPHTPTLSPKLTNNSHHIGPSIPDDMRKVLAQTCDEVIKYISSDEGDGIGPLPIGIEGKHTEAHERLEERATEIKIRQLEGRSIQTSNIKSREQWMLELPDGKTKYLGLEARSFRAKAGPDMSDRSSWTDTPEEKAKKEAGIVKEEDSNKTLLQEAKERHIAKRDDEQERAVKKHKKKHRREESLLDMHQKKLKKKKKKEEKHDEKKERRPFSRDTDMQVNRFDDAQKKSIIKKAQGLNTRFSTGEAKFL